MKGSGGAAARRRARNQTMAAALKAAGVTRNTGACPVCHNVIGNGQASFLAHSNSSRCLPKKLARRPRGD